MPCTSTSTVEADAVHVDALDLVDTLDRFQQAADLRGQ